MIVVVSEGRQHAAAVTCEQTERYRFTVSVRVAKCVCVCVCEGRTSGQFPGGAVSGPEADADRRGGLGRR